MQTRYLSTNGFRYELRSNPYRASTSGGASSEGTMGWTLSKYDQNGRLVSEQTFAGAGLPAPWGSNGTSAGVITTSYAADVTTVIDQDNSVRPRSEDPQIEHRAAPAG